MAADVSSHIRFLTGCIDDRTVGNEAAAGKSTVLITRDLLGVDCGGFANNSDDDSQELDLDLQVPSGWEKRLDLKSGKVYLQRCNSSNSPSSSSDNRHRHSNQTVPKIQDLNFPPSPSKISFNLFDDNNLELKLVSPTSAAEPSSSSGNYLSVCTLDRVKSALEKAEKESVNRKRSTFPLKSSSFTSSSPSTREIHEEENKDKIVTSPVAAGCPGCLSYVLIMKHNPECPRCKSIVPMPMMKKPRIDLNISM